MLCYCTEKKLIRRDLFFFSYPKNGISGVVEWYTTAAKYKAGNCRFGEIIKASEIYLAHNTYIYIYIYIYIPESGIGQSTNKSCGFPMIPSFI